MDILLAERQADSSEELFCAAIGCLKKFLTAFETTRTAQKTCNE